MMFVCGHLASSHPDPATGDTRCLVVEDRRDPLHVFDNGRATKHGCRAWLHYGPASAPAAESATESAELSERWPEFAAGLRRPEDLQ